MQRLGKQEGVLGAILPVYLVISVHHGPDAGLLDGRLEGREVDLVEGARVDLLVDAVALKLLVVGGEMLHRRDHVLGLHALDERHAHARGQVGVLAVTLEIPAP